MIGWLLTLPVFFGVVINEVYPNAEAKDGEWIELYNEAAETVDMSGWQLDDAEGGTKPYFIDKITIPGKGYWVFEQKDTKIALNNDGDQVRLFDSTNSLINSITFPPKLNHRQSWGKTNTATYSIIEFPSKGLPNYDETITSSPTASAIEIVIKSVLGCPDNRGKEWVELENKGNSEVRLANWIIKTQAGRTKEIKSTIGDQGTIKIEWDSGFLSNEGTKIYLINDAGVEVDNIDVPPCVKTTPTNKPPSPTPTIKPTSFVKPDLSPTEIKPTTTTIKAISNYPTFKQASVAGIMEEEIVASESSLPTGVLPVTGEKSPTRSIGSWLVGLGFGVMLLGALDIRKHLYV
jgi:hypothetical protein